MLLKKKTNGSGYLMSMSIFQTMVLFILFLEQ